MPFRSSILVFSLIFHGVLVAQPHSSAYSAGDTAQLTSFDQRREAFLNKHLAGASGIHGKMALLQKGVPLTYGDISRSIEKIQNRKDCSDFDMVAIVRIFYQFGEDERFAPALRDSLKKLVIHFKYWPDEPGTDNMCTWSENHYILFSSAGYLMGQYFMNETFVNADETGMEKMQKMRPRILRWLDLRFSTGFSEWLSNVYYTEDIAALVNLIDFSQDPEITTKATMVLDLLLLDMALNHFKGTFAGTHGRSYFKHKISGNRESSGGIFNLMFGLNDFRTNMATAALALSTNYRMPPVIYHIANAAAGDGFENKQRMGIRIEDAERWGLDRKNIEDGMTFMTLEAYCHPKTINLTMKVFDEYNLWENDFFKPFNDSKGLINAARKTGTLPLVAKLFKKDLSRNVRTEVNIYTYKTDDYMLSTAQDYNKGMGGDQHAIWSAALGPEAICFTTHPANEKLKGSTPNYWTGSGNLPRSAQHENVHFSLYKISTRPGIHMTHKLKFTHAWLPKDKFDEVTEKGGWIFARKNDGFLALWSKKPYRWQNKGKFTDKEVIAEGKKNVWICELGSKKEYGSFEKFINFVSNAKIETSGLDIIYHSPSQGKLEFGWDKPLRQNGRVISLRDYPRYDNKYVKAGFPADVVEIPFGDQKLILDYTNLRREVITDHEKSTISEEAYPSGD